MASPKAIAIRRQAALDAIQGILAMDTHVRQRDPSLAEAVLLEHIAGCLEAQQAAWEAERAEIAGYVLTLEAALAEAEQSPVDLQAAIDAAGREAIVALVGVGERTADRMMEGREERKEKRNESQI